jgi:hypothetical protein
MKRPTKTSLWLPLPALSSAALATVLLTALAATAWPAAQEAAPPPAAVTTTPSAPAGSVYPAPQVDASAPIAEPSPTF